MTRTASSFNPSTEYAQRLHPLIRKAPFVLRITRHRDVPGVVFVIKERIAAVAENMATTLQSPVPIPGGFGRSRLVERGFLAGEAQRRCLPIVRRIVSRVSDPLGVPLELQRFLSIHGMKEPMNLPLDDDAGAKLAVLFKLQERVADLDRVELIARRVALFTREEAGYWLSRMTRFDPDANRWAVSGLRLLLGGQPNDPGVERMLEKLRME